ncbi:MAG TPA: sigma-70 family RNA polymerase sigma factor [Tepidisphaeraceae bacterium]|jgi:RNA polymerase sigma-70 factor (ECF subfamily)
MSVIHHDRHPSLNSHRVSHRSEIAARRLFSDFNTWASPSAATYSFPASPSRWKRSRRTAMKCVRSIVGIDQDYTIMTDIAAGNTDALTRLHQRYGGVVYAICLRVLGNHAEAEECVINIFWEIWNRSSRYDAERAAPLTYITTLARSRAIDRRRSNNVHNHSGVSLDSGREQSLGASLASPVLDPATATIHAEVRGRISSAMQKLDPIHREIIECSYFDGLSHSQIASKLGKPLGTIKTFIRQSLSQLRQALGRDEDMVPALARVTH